MILADKIWTFFLRGLIAEAEEQGVMKIRRRKSRKGGG